MRTERDYKDEGDYLRKQAALIVGTSDNYEFVGVRRETFVQEKLEQFATKIEQYDLDHRDTLRNFVKCRLHNLCDAQELD